MSALGASQLPKIDRLLLIRQRTGSPIAKEPTVFNIMRLAIQQVEEIFLQGFATGPGLGREHAAGGFRDAANLESDHEGILPLTISGMGSSQSGDRALGPEQLAAGQELRAQGTSAGDRSASSSRTSGATSVPKSSIERIVLA